MNYWPVRGESASFTTSVGVGSSLGVEDEHDSDSTTSSADDSEQITAKDSQKNKPGAPDPETSEEQESTLLQMIADFVKRVFGR